MFWVYRLLSSLQTPFRLLVCGDGSCLMLFGDLSAYFRFRGPSFMCAP
ncbi:hypothetical protein HanHA300_Chr08g0281921 [Helianthus annuus]|nr:hypothetical protein HanHA300_Chr08g0281921 [Helianthus annuus]